MKRFLNPVFTFILGALIFGGIGTVLAVTLLAKDISFTPSDNTWKKANGENITNVKDALDDVYNKITTNTASELKKICTYIDNTYSKDKNDKYSVGTKYSCDPGDGTKRNFYILKISGEKVDLIMEQNIAKGTMTWYNAMKYFTDGAGVSIKKSWTNVQDIDLPKAQDIANAVGRNSWKAAENSAWWCLESKKQDSSSSPYCNNTTQKTLWLWDYTRECSSWKCKHSLNSEWGYGYWTRDAIVNTGNAWAVTRIGNLGANAASDATNFGVRPVITVYRSNLQ